MNAVNISHKGLDPKPLAGQRALVTGALGGLGRSITELLGAAGAEVIVHHFQQTEDAADFASELERQGTVAHIAEADITDWSAVTHMFEDLASRCGTIDILVNNAGFMETRSIVDSSLEDWRRTLETDLDGVFIVSRHALTRMLATGRGVIVNVASQLAFKGAHNYVSYSAAKAGVVGFTRALYREVGPEIRVNAVAPGPIVTPLIEEIATDEFVAERTSGAVLQRLGKPEEVAPAVLFLATDGAALMHGQTIHLNGGGVMA